MAMGAATAAAAPPPADLYTRPPLIVDVAISPTGKRLALRVTGKDNLVRLAVMDLAPVTKPRVVGAVRDGDVESVSWVNDDRLVYEAYRHGVATVDEYGAGTFAVNADGSDTLQLIAWKNEDTTGTNIASRVLPYGWYFDSTIGDGSDDVLLHRRVTDSDGELLQVNYARLDTHTRRLRNLSEGLPPDTVRVVFDAATQPRIAISEKDGRQLVRWRPKPGGEWEKIGDFDSLEGGFTPRHINPDGEVLVTTELHGVQGLYRLDPATHQVDPNPLVEVKGFDLKPALEVDSKTHRMVGLHFVADRPMSYWFDDKLQAIQKAVDAALPGRSNRLYCGECESTRFLVIRSTSDRQPGEFLLFDRQEASLVSLGASRPWIAEASQGRRTFHRYAARDGLQVPIVVTHPPGAALDKPLPAVVLVHGGPFVRGGDVRWEAEAQFLASRGYRVLEPEYRGSTGFGKAHFKAGWRQWGRAMQDDLADGVQWAVKQGLVDAGRVCVMGASYGGYAALISPVVHPGVYRCAVSFAGVTDLSLLFTFGWGDISTEYVRYGAPRLVGDPVTEKDRLKAESPINRVADLKVPVLLAHGQDDQRVPIEHSHRFASAAKDAGVKIETAFYAGEGHGWFKPEDHLDFLQRVERLLQESLQSKP
ncbi:MAG: S9 family peptidase [Rhizobacter sp.]|nr:S9 family peptidase [Rhizobacter sp.]